ncbi:Salivary acidic proline-rich phosphoprotein 1/2 [Vanrija albida]|uniref:RNA helicase n=1 Tax=Vanrija albida TaxID=181172 RepID=A0ABR3Q4S8_9TREE
MPPAQPGPSKPKKAQAQAKGKAKARVANFFSDDDDDEHEAAAAAPQPLANGALRKKRRLNDKKGKGRAGPGSAELERIARELLVKRYELPFYQGRRDILAQILENDTVVIIGETGCGKSTQLGQLLRRHALALGHYGPRGPSVAITQPRRLPTISLATRVAAEMGVTLGGEVGYAVRFEDACSRDTRVRFMTEGVLMRELANDGGKGGKGKANGSKPEDDEDEDESADALNLLLRYDVVIIDEAHERTLNTDFLLGSMKKIQRIRKARAAAGDAIAPLKIVIMSATLDPVKFTAFFDGAPALHVPGRMFDVATSHTARPVDDFIEAAADAALMVHSRKPSPAGEMLVFMPGSDEIENLVSLLKRRGNDLAPDATQLQVLPLYASLPQTAQAKIFAPTPANTRRVVVATNIAETSLTIPGVGFVIDSGYKKEKEFIYRASGAIEHLRKMEISQASAWQRTGRAGREMPGECLRLYTEAAFRKMPEFDTPEIQRCNLANAVLQLIAMRQDPFTFEYIDPPSRDSIAAAFRTLAGLGAISSPTVITPLGRQMLHYPLDPEHARILVAAFELGCAAELIDILSLVVAGPVFHDRGDTRETAAAARAKFIHRDGDHLTAMNVLRAYLSLRADNDEDDEPAVGKGGIGAWCRDNHVNGKTLAAAARIRKQLRSLAERHGADATASCGSDYTLVGRALLQGLFMNTAVIQADGSYRQTVGALTVKIHPASVLAGRKAPAIVYDELAITSAIYARNVSAFDQDLLVTVPWFQKAGAAQPVSRRKV